MKRAQWPFGRWTVLGACLALGAISSCKGDEDQEPSGDGDGDGDGDVGDGDGDLLATGGQGGAPNNTGGSPEMGGMGGEGTGGVPSLLALPDVLSETGLYEADMETLGKGVRPFRPQFPLWTDGAEKRRWIYLPEGEQIDTSDMNYWDFPIGTKLWKEFSRDGVRVETRLLERRFNGVWVMVAYQWRLDLSDADKVIDGVVDASGTEHDIPSESQCWACHNQMPGRVLGFSAIQLAHDAGVNVPGIPQENEWTLDQLESAGLFSDAPPATITVPGNDTERAALTYLHGNCGHCHHPFSSVSGRVDMQLLLTVEGLSSVDQTVTYQTTVGVEASLPGDGPEGADYRISPADLNASAVYQRFNSVGETYSMPPLGTEIIDPSGEEALRLWIESLPQ